MASKTKFIDVWIIESNTVYREVPYAIVADWIQQGRVLAEDRVRQSGTGDWFTVSETPAFAAYMPRSDPFRAEDQAEALEPVQVDFVWKQPRGDADEDVDMVPLIDVSLVLLIFFMMTASVTTASSQIRTPAALMGVQMNSDEEAFWVGIQLVNGAPVYSIGQGSRPAAAEDRELTEQQVFERLESRLQGAASADLRIDAEPGVAYEVVKALVVRAEALRGRRLIDRIHAGVSEK